MSDKFLFSIVIPVYNVEKYLNRCFDSIEGLSEDTYEVILVNDGSTDHSEEICKETVNRRKNFKLINQEHDGLSAARNTGIKNASGKYIVFLDSDDFLKENALVKIEELLKGKDTDCFLGKAIKYYENNNTYISSKLDYNKYDDTISASELYMKINNNSAYWLAPFKFIVKREFIISNNLFFEEGILHEDELWVPKVIVNAKRLELFDYEFYVYRIGREGSIINTKNIKKVFDKILIADKLFELSNEYSGSSRKILRYRSAALVFGMIITIREYEGEKNYTLLIEELIDRKKYLYISKYKIIYLLCSVFSVKKVCDLYNKFFSKYNK